MERGQPWEGMENTGHSYGSVMEVMALALDVRALALDVRAPAMDVRALALEVRSGRRSC